MGFTPETFVLAKNLGGGSSPSPILQSKTVNQNGVVLPDSGYDALSQVNVEVPPTVPTLQSKFTSENGIITPDQAYDGLSSVEVNVNQTPLSTMLLCPYGASSTAFRLVDNRVLTGFHNLYGFIAPSDISGNWLIFDWREKWEIGCAFLKSKSSGNYTLFGEESNNTRWADIPSAEISESTLGFGVSTVGNNTWTIWINFNTSIQLDKWYFMTFAYDPSTKIVTGRLTDDFQTYETHTQQLEDDPYYNSTYKLGFGGLMRQQAHANGAGDMDLFNTYIKINDVITWGHFTGAFPT